MINNKEELKIGNEVKFDKIPIGHFFTDLIHIFESVKSGKVIESSHMPEYPVMRTYAHLPCLKQKDIKPRYSIGKITIDYFNNDFMYLGAKKTADKFISLLEKGCS